MYYVYILTNWNDSVIYISVLLVTSNVGCMNIAMDWLMALQNNTMSINWCTMNVPMMCIVQSQEKNSSKNGREQKRMHLYLR